MQIVLKWTIALFFILMILSGCQKKQKIYKTAEFNDGLIKILNPVENSLPLKIKSYSVLETKNDTIDIYLGFLKQGQQAGNWIAVATKDQIRAFKTVDITHSKEENNVIDVEFNNSTKLISLRIKKLDTVENKIIYSWVDQTGLTDSIAIIKNDKPIMEGKALPSIELTDINEDQYNLTRFKDQIIVLNWWSVSCAPCLKEIPGLNKLVNKYADKNVRFVSVTDDSINKVSSFLEKNEFRYDITFISEDDTEIFGNSYPKNIVIDSTKTISFYNEGGNENIWLEINEHLTKIYDK